MLVPSVPQTGKGAKVSLSFNDGIATTGFAMTMQASYSYNGETLTDKVYLLGSGKMINSRPAANPFAYINGILDGADVSSTVADKVSITAGNKLVNNVTTGIVAKSDLSISRPSSGEAVWNAIVVNTSTGVVSEVTGTETTAGTGKAALLTTYGTAAGQKPLIAADELLLFYVGIDSTSGVITSDEMNFDDREWASFSYQMMPSIGGVMIAEALPKIHTGAIARSVYFSGKYWDTSALAAVGDAQQWSVTPNTSSVSAVTFTGGPSESQIDNWSFTFNQLFTDAKALDAIYNRQGYAAVKLQLASGQYFLFVGSFAGGISVEPGSFIIQSLSGSIQDRPYWSGQ
jgi:hypothetical protein